MRTDCIVKLSELQIFELNTLVHKVTNGHAEGKPPLSDKDLYNFVDSQAALRRLQNISLTGGQRVCYDITMLCRMLPLQNNKVHLTRVPGHREIQGNEHADRLTRAGLGRKASNPFYLPKLSQRKAEEDVLATWKQE
jgi:hypothetical protein